MAHQNMQSSPKNCLFVFCLIRKGFKVEDGVLLQTKYLMCFFPDNATRKISKNSNAFI